MTRREFTKATKRDAYERSEGCCEGILTSGERCNANLAHKPCHYDHVIPDAIGGDNSLQNCAVLCLPCHLEKTTKRDIPIIAKSKRIADKHRGIRKRSTFACSRDSKWKKRIDGSVVAR